MTINEFKDYVCDKVKERLGGEYTLKTAKVTKNNGLVFTGVSFYKEAFGVSPTIYMEQFHEAYEKGASLEEIIDEITDIFKREAPKFNFDFEALYDYEKLKDKLYCRVVNYEKNKDLAAGSPCVKIMDLCVLFFIYVDSLEGACGSILIKNDMFEYWNIDISKLYNDALENTKRLFDIKIMDLNEVFKEIVSRHCDKDSAEYDMLMEQIESDLEIPMYVLTNSVKTYGATGILYTEELEAFAKTVDSDLYILPSSVHELIVIPVWEEADNERLLSMVRQVNSTEVPADEVLSDSVYIFKRQDKCISGIYSA